MADAGVQDLLSFDRDVARGARALAAWRAAVASAPDEHANDEPLEPVRRVAGKSAWDALAALAPSAADAPLRDALRPWVYALTQARIGLRDDVAWARAASAPRGRLGGDAPRQVSWREAWRGMVAAGSPAQAGLWLDAAADTAPLLAEAARTRAARRAEVARRMGLDHPWAPIVSVAPGDLRAAARRFLDATDDLSHAVGKGAPGDAGGPGAVIHAAVAREAGHGWPAHLTPRWLQDAFAPGTRAMRRGLDLPPLPPALGAASFARALYAFGFALRAGPERGAPSASGRSPFALARPPAFVAAHRFGFVFAALAADAEWQARALGLGRRAALAQARVLGRTALFDARLHAVRLLLGDEASFAPRAAFEELGARLFGAPLDARLCGAWPAARDDEPARLLALLDVTSFAAGLRDRFDADWFRNPRAWEDLASRADGPAKDPEDAPADAAALSSKADALAHAFEGALG
jgi:hypothetical protein